MKGSILASIFAQILSSVLRAEDMKVKEADGERNARGSEKLHSVLKDAEAAVMGAPVSDDEKVKLATQAEPFVNGVVSVLNGLQILSSTRKKK